MQATAEQLASPATQDWLKTTKVRSEILRSWDTLSQTSNYHPDVVRQAMAKLEEAHRLLESIG